jgi:DNA-binding MarR family transcriptional regulator/GNAT superfamily N-acetyltransferase
MVAPELDSRINAVRQFNRFYTQKIGVLAEGLARSSFSLAQARVLYELAHRNSPTAKELANDLGMDPGYLSRILSDFQSKGLIVREPSPRDGRVMHLTLTPAGREAFAPLNQRSQEEMAALLAPLSETQQERLVQALRTVQALLSSRTETQATYVLRPHRPGDLGWIISRHGALYAQEYGWNQEFEALVAEIAAKFLKEFDPAAARCWIAEREGEKVGSVLVVRESETTAKLRLLLVEPSARGIGIGGRMVEECIGFARVAGYRKLTLWTNSVLTAARRIYEAKGFTLVKSEPHRSFGHDLVGEYWELGL